MNLEINKKPGNNLIAFGILLFNQKVIKILEPCPSRNKLKMFHNYLFRMHRFRNNKETINLDKNFCIYFAESLHC